jgi:hypothetical protein
VGRRAPAAAAHIRHPTTGCSPPLPPAPGLPRFPSGPARLGSRSADAAALCKSRRPVMQPIRECPSETR